MGKGEKSCSGGKKKKEGKNKYTQRQEKHGVSESGNQRYFANGKSDPQIGDTVVFISLCFKIVPGDFSIRVNLHIRFGSISNQAV